MDIQELYDVYSSCKIVSTDSRSITPGCLFFALKGDNFNGNLFAEEALEKGARVAIVDENPAEPNRAIVKVDDVLFTLQELAAYHREQIGIPIFAITGSNGKTTTKELCKAVVSEQFTVFATAGNLNNHIGVPLTLLSMDDTIGFGIVEMGANHPGEIARLCEIAQPDFGLITNIGKAHLEGFGGIQGVTRAKGELFDFLMKHGKTILVNEGDSSVCGLVPADYPGAIWYNGHKGLHVERYTSDPYATFQIRVENRSIKVQTRMLGGYNAENVLAAISVGSLLGIAEDSIIRAIGLYQPSNNRSQLIDTGKNRIFMDAYNANPSSMVSAVNEFLQFKSPKKLLILGEMRELGDYSQAEHEELVIHLINHDIKDVVCVGKAFEQAAINAGYHYAENTEQLRLWLSDNPLSGYFVFIKGSRSNQLEKLVPLL
jgi:UDP-N-acetylmuramoyl-tripeptide--D-alanyl-D-alanine ligase